MSRQSAVVVRALFPGLVALLFSSCDGGPVGTSAHEGPYISTGQGYLQIGVTMTGVLPSRTATVIIDDTLIVPLEGFDEQQPAGATARVRVNTGFHRLRLSGMEANCEDHATVDAWVSDTEERSAFFLVHCRGTSPVTGHGMAWISQGDWGNDLSLMSPEGDILQPNVNAWDATDLAWSTTGDALAMLSGSKDVVFLDGAGSTTVRQWSGLFNGVSLAWLPGQDALSVLELFPTGCKIRVIGAPWTPQSYRFIPCGAGSSGEDARGDIAWSPEGKTIAVGLRRDESLRLVDPITGLVAIHDLPKSGYTPIALAWRPDGSSLYVLTLCIPGSGCTPARLLLLQYGISDQSWKELRSWNTTVDLIDRATLELFGADYLAVGPVNRNVLLVPLNGDGQSRALLGENEFRVSRRP